MTDAFDFRTSVAYDDVRKREFHRLARRQLGLLAKALDLPSGSYDLRSNMAGIAVSGEITLHAERIYVQTSQPFGASTPESSSEPATAAKTISAVRTTSPRSIFCISL